MLPQTAPAVKEPLRSPDRTDMSAFTDERLSGDTRDVEPGPPEAPSPVVSHDERRGRVQRIMRSDAEVPRARLGRRS
jgi:hypothetical protein